LSIVAAGSDDVWSTRDNALTDVSPELVGSTAANDLVYTAGTVASAVDDCQFNIKFNKPPISPMTELNNEGAVGIGGGDGLGAALHGSSPSSYTEPPRGFSFTKLPPKLPVPEAV
jgi:hypothetical protein